MTFDDYTAAVKRQYDMAKGDVFGGYLLTPSPAQLRNLCLLVFDNGLNRNDLEVFKIFFEVTDESMMRTRILNFDVDKLKPLQQFLNGKNATTNQHNLNLIAVLVNLEPRPLHHFLRNGIMQAKEPIRQELEEKNTITAEIHPPSLQEPKKRPRALVIVLLVFGILLLGYTSAKAFFPPELQCMQWQKDHYEIVACEVSGIMSGSDIEPFDVRKSGLRKIAVDKKTTFFQNGIPLVYYISRDGNYEYFNGGGLHPISGKGLRPITTYMIEKHILNRESN